MEACFSIFDKDGDIDSITNKFIKTLNGIIAKSFKKVRISNKFNKQIDLLFQKRNILNKRKK